MTEHADDERLTSVSYGALVADRPFLLTILVSFTGGLGLSAVPVALPAIADELGVADASVGLVMTVFALPLIVLIPLIGVLADTYGRRPVVLVSLVLFGAAGLATSVVSSFHALLLLRAVQGIAFAGTLPLSTTLIGDFYTGPEGAAAQGFRSSVNGIAGTIAPAIAGVLVGFAWHLPFGLFAFAFPVFVLVYRYFPEPVSTDVDPGRQVTASLYRYWRAFREEAADVTFLLLAVGGFTDLFIREAVLVFVPLFAVRSVGATVFETGLVLAAFGVIVAVSSPLAGESVAALGRKRTLIASVGLMGLGVLLLPLATDVVTVAVLVVVFGAGEAIFIPSLNDSMATFSSDDRRGGIIGSIQSVKNVGRAAGPAFFGVVLAVAGFTAVFVVAALCAGLYALTVMRHFDPEAV